MQPPSRPYGTPTGGSGGKRKMGASPRRLSAAFDARKRPPRNNTHPAATEWKHASPPFTGMQKTMQPLPLHRHTHHTQQSRIPAARTPQAADGCRSIPQGQMRRLCRGLLPLQAEIQATLCNRSRPDSSRDTHRNGARGGPGESHAHLAFPRRLSAAFDARKRPPRNNTHPAATEWKHAQPPFTGMQNNAAPPTS